LPLREGGCEANSDGHCFSGESEDFVFDPAAVFRGIKGFAGEFGASRQHKFDS